MYSVSSQVLFKVTLLLQRQFLQSMEIKQHKLYWVPSVNQFWLQGNFALIIKKIKKQKIQENYL